MSSPRLLLATLSLATVLIAADSLADDKDRSKQLFEQGVSQMEAKKYDAACPLLEESQKIAPFPGTLFTLAECESLRGRSAVAFTRYTEYLDVYEALPKDKQVKQGTRQKDARAKREKLAKQIGLITLILPSNAPSGTTVTVAGRTLDERSIALPVPLDPGEYTVIATTPDGTTTETKMTVDKGRTHAVTLEVRAAPATSTTTMTTAAPTPSSRPVASAPTDLRKITTYATGGLGLAALALGGVTFGLMLAKKGDVDAGCTDAGPGVKSCTPEGVAAGNDAKLFGTIATVGLAAGVALAGVSVALFVTAPKKKEAAQTGTFEVRAAPLGLSGTMVEARGRF